MTTIEFNHTSNVFLNTGIIAIHYYLEKCVEDDCLGYPIDQSNFQLKKDKLIITHDNLFQLLEDVYYLMGKEVYDTATNKQLDELGNVFYNEKIESFSRFPKIYTLGLTNLITNNAQGGTREESNTIKLEELKKTKPEIAEKVENYFADNKMTLLSKIYFNEPYTKITRLEKPDNQYFESGTEFCYLTGESYKKLVDTQNTSPFFSGLTNFNSHLKGNDKKISWKAMYLSRFAPKFCLYMYVSGLDGMVCYLFESGNLIQLKDIIRNENRSIFKTKSELLDANYMSNFKFHNFNYKKENEDKLTPKSDYTEQAEITFMLIYTIYRQILFNQGINETTDADDDFDPMSESSFKKLPVSLVSFRADKFATTLRPNGFEYFNNFKSSIRLISHLEKNGVNFQQALGSLKFIKPSEKSSKNSYRLERQKRNKVLKKILNRKPILTDIERLFFQCYTLLTSRGDVGFKNFKVLQQLVESYQPIIYSNENNMKEETENLQEKAVKFGSSIAISIIGYDNAATLSEKQANAKNGRVYIIALHKARTLSQFTEAVIRIQKKYNLIFSSELLNNINEDNFEIVRQFAIISALNQINSVLKNTQSS